ncbi:MAG TPA: hypothetical protein VGO69_08420, partial [Pyrinomonadaceae bacterium]|nr:hypothetical protein [Pyrinomonadaceae bacterium]
WKFAAHFKPLLWLCALWILAYTAFLFVWLPQNTFYRLFYLPALIIMAGLLLASARNTEARPRTYRVALLVMIVSLFNFLFLIYPSSYVQKYPPLALALEMNQVWPRGTVIYYAFENSDNSLFHYFNPPATWKQLKSMGTNELESELQNIYAAGGTAWLDVFALEQLSSTPDGAAWLASHAKEQTRREVMDRAYKIKFVQIVP